MARADIIDDPTTTISPRRGRIVFTTIGSLGDLYPNVVIALELQRRGHDVLIAANDGFAPYLDRYGVPTTPIRPDMFHELMSGDTIHKVMDRRGGTEFLLTRVVLPNLRAMHESIVEATRGADVLVSNLLTLTAPMIAEKLAIPWAAMILQPTIFLSPGDPPLLPQFPVVSRFWQTRPWLVRMARRGADIQMGRALRPVGQFRRELDLPAASGNPLLDWQVSPWLNLAMFSPVFAQPQPDWPPRTLAAGFPFFPADVVPPLSDELSGFLAGGPPPLVFTLGSSAVFSAGNFYRDAALAAERLGMRAVLMVGPDLQNRPSRLPDSILCVDYAPHALLFPRAAAVIHQCGIGTTAEGMRAGKPMLAVPFAHDQPDNAARIERLGIARVLPRDRIGEATLHRELTALLTDPGYTRRAAEVAAIVRRENSASAAADAIERLLPGPGTESSLAPSRVLSAVR